MGGCCGAMKTGQKSLPDKKKSADPIQEKTNGKEVAAQATVPAANDTGKASKDLGGGDVHAEKRQKNVDGPTLEQIAVPVKVSVSHAESAGDKAVEPPGQAAENVMDLETAVAPFESLPSSGEAQGSITSAEPEVLLPFQIPVQHTFTSTTTTTTTTTTGHEETFEEFKLRVDEPQLDFAFPGDVQLSITENVQTAPFEEEAHPVSGDVEIVAKSFAAVEDESAPQSFSAEGVEAGGVEGAVTRVETAIVEAELPVEEDLPPPPPLEASPPEEVEACTRFEIHAFLPTPATVEVAVEAEPWHDPRLAICPLERKPRPERRHDGDVQVCPLEEIPYPGPGPRDDGDIQVCPLEEIPYPGPEARDDGDIQVCPLEEIPYPGPEARDDGDVQVCPLEEIPYPGPEPRDDEDVQVCPLEDVPYPGPDSGVQICPLERRPEPERPAGVVVCPLEEIPYPGPDLGVQICPLERWPQPEPGQRPAGVVVCPLERVPYPGPRTGPAPSISVEGVYPGYTITRIGANPDPDIAICPPEEPRPDPDIAICPPEEPRPEPDIEICPEPEILVCPPYTGDVVLQGETDQSFGSKLEEEHPIPAQDDFPPPVVEAPAIYDSLLESYEVLDASSSAEHPLPQPPVEAEIGASAEPIISFTENEQTSEHPLLDLTAATLEQELQSEQPAAYQEQQPVEAVEPYHEQQQSQEPTPYQEHHSHEESSAGHWEQQSHQDPAPQEISGGFEVDGDAVKSSLEEQEQQQLPVLEVISDQVQQNRDIWWDESGREQQTSGEPTTMEGDVPVLELVSEQVREAHQTWWDQSAATPTGETAVQPEEAVSSTEQQAPEEHSWIPLAETAAPIQPEETVSPIAADGSFPEVVASEPVSASSDLVVKDAEIVPETKELPATIESPLSADGSSSTVPTENGEVSAVSSSSEETSVVSNLSPEGIDDPAAAAGVASTKEPIPTQA